MDAAVCGDLHGALVQLLEEQVSIVGVDVAVVVEVGVVLIGDGIQDAGDIVQERLAVGLGDLAVAKNLEARLALGQAVISPIWPSTVQVTLEVRSVVQVSSKFTTEPSSN